MKLHDGKVRGNKRISKVLNKPVEGELAEKKSPVFTLIFLIAAFLILLVYSIIELGIKEGMYFSAGLSIVAIILYFLNGKNIKQREKFLKKYQKNTSDNNDK